MEQPFPRRNKGSALRTAAVVTFASLGTLATWSFRATALVSHQNFSGPFTRQVLTPPPEAPYNLRFFTTPVKTDSKNQIITGPNSDPVKNIVGAEPAGLRGGLMRFTKIMFGAGYFDGRPDKSTRIDPNDPQVSSGNSFWPHRDQPFRSWPNALALTPDGKKLYVTLPGREGYPDWRVAVVDTGSRKVLRWIDLRPGQNLGTRPVAVQVSPVNASIYATPYAVVLNQYGNFASVIDTANDLVIGEFETGFYGEDLVFNRAGTRLYITDRFKDEVHAFKIDAGPFFTPIGEIPTGTNDLDRTNPRDLDISADGNTLYAGNTLGHTIAAINIQGDANTLLTNLPVGGLVTDIKIAGRWGIVSGHETNTVLNQPETGHGLPKMENGVAVKNSGQPLGYTPVMTDATRATTFDDIGSELNILDTSTNRFVYRYVDSGRDSSMLITPGQIVDLGDHAAAQKILSGSGPEQIAIKGNLLFVSMLHSDKVEVFRINQNPADPSQILTPVGTQYTGGITPQGLAVSPDGATVYVANMQTEDVSFLGSEANGNLTRQGFVVVGVTDKTPDPTKNGDKGSGLFATDEEAGLRWLFTQSYSDDGQKSCGFCHWQSRHDGGQWNVGANAVGGVKISPQNKDISDNWPEWFEGLNNNMSAYASACNGELVNAERKTSLFPQDQLVDRLHARDSYVQQKTAENSIAIGRPELSGKAFKTGYYDMAFLQILWTQNETRRMPNPLTQFASATDAQTIARGKSLFTMPVSQGGAGCADCHRNGNKFTNGVLDNTFQDYNIPEPGVISETTVDGNGPFMRLANDDFFQQFAPPQDEGSRQNISSRNTKHLRSFWDSVPLWLHHGDAHSLREILLPPDSPLLRPGERGFNFRTVRTDHSRAVSNSFLGGNPVVLPTEVPITFGDSRGALAGDGKGPIYVSLDSPFATNPDGSPEIDRLGTNNLAPLIVSGQINPALAANHVQVIKDTHGATSKLSASDIDAIAKYVLSLE